MTSSDYARMKKPCLSSHQKEQLKGGYITPHNSKLTSAQKVLQHIRAKSYKLCVNLVDFGGTAQKEQMVYLARGAMSMSKLMANPTNSTIVGI